MSDTKADPLREAFKFVDDLDWDYLERVLINNIRHSQDAQNGIWLTAMKAARAALAAPQPAAPLGGREAILQVLDKFGFEKGHPCRGDMADAILAAVTPTAPVSDRAAVVADRLIGIQEDLPEEDDRAVVGEAAHILRTLVAKEDAQ